MRQAEENAYSAAGISRDRLCAIHVIITELLLKAAKIIVNLRNSTPHATLTPDFPLFFKLSLHLMMKKIDILNYITNFRKSPNEVKTHQQLVAHIGAENEPALNAMLSELKQLRTIKETELLGEKAYQVVSK